MARIKQFAVLVGTAAVILAVQQAHSQPRISPPAVIGGDPGPAPAAALPAPSTLPGPGGYPASPPAPAMAPPPGLLPSPATPYPGPGAYPPGVAAPGPVPGPAATVPGAVQPVPPFDPYASAPPCQPSPLLPQDPYLPAGACPTPSYQAVTRFLQEIRVDQHWLNRSGANGFGANNIDTSATFAFPFLYNREVPILVTPGFGLDLWDGPSTSATGFDFPARTYDAYLNAAWNPRITPWLAAELGARIGVYSDFEKLTSNSIRVQGEGLAVLFFSECFQIKFGIDYLNRNRVKLLPAGGIVWKPNCDTEIDITFPDPKFAHRWTTNGCVDWWWYVRGEYGGGAWTVDRQFAFPPGANGEQSVDYNDLRVALGLEFMRMAGLKGNFETGVSFDREIYYPIGNQTFNAPTTFFLGGGVRF